MHLISSSALPLRLRLVIGAAAAALVVGSTRDAKAMDFEPADRNRPFVVVNLDAGGLQIHPEWDFSTMGRLATGIGWFNGRRVLGVQAEVGVHGGPRYSLGLGGEYASVRTGLSLGAAVMRDLTAEAFGGRVELGLSVLRLQALAYDDAEKTRQLSLFVRVPVGLIASVLLGAL